MIWSLLTHLLAAAVGGVAVWAATRREIVNIKADALDLLFARQIEYSADAIRRTGV